MTQFGYHFLQEGFSVPQAWPSTTPPVFVAFSFAVVHHLIMSDSLWPHELQHARLPCPLLPPGVCWNSYPLNQWCHPTVSSSVALNLTQHQSFLVSRLFASGGQSIGASASASAFPMKIQGWFPLGLTGLISFLSKRLSWVFSSPSTYQMTLHLLWTDLSLAGLSLFPGLSLVCLRTKSAQKGPGIWQVFNRHPSSYPRCPLGRATPSPNKHSLSTFVQP